MSNVNIVSVVITSISGLGLVESHYIMAVTHPM